MIWPKQLFPLSAFFAFFLLPLLVPLYRVLKDKIVEDGGYPSQEVSWSLCLYKGSHYLKPEASASLWIIQKAFKKTT